MFLTLYKSALRPIEIKALLKLKIKGNTYAPPEEPLELLATRLNDRDFCYAALGKVSRSFSAVIQQLPDELKDAVCIFYLVLRALDTIEDDMSLSIEKKEPLLLEFYKHAQDETFSISGIGDNRDYMVLLENYPKVTRTFDRLNIASKKTIIEITKQMGQGMAEFMKKDVKTIADFDLYCHYVAGLVGIGLTRLFYAFNPSSITVADSDEISNSMGLFLQKTNIIRDYHEDLFSERSFWPEEIWGAHVNTLNYLAINPRKPESLAALNHMVADALRHIPDCIDYLNNVKDKKIFNFTAVPQIMAVATLAKLYNNQKVLKGVVKVRKGLAARLMIYNVTINDVYKYFRKSIRTIEKKNKPGTPYYQETADVLESIKGSLSNKFM
jgi:farnesyl-diphosphate farnesyltransferase